MHINVFKKNPIAFERMFQIEFNKIYALFEFGPRRRPNPCTTLTNRRLYWIRLLARPVFFFFFSCFSTFGVCPLTLPARANEPCTLPPNNGTFMSNSKLLKALAGVNKSKMVPSHDNVNSAASTCSKLAILLCNQRNRNAISMMKFGCIDSIVKGHCVNYQVDA